MHVTMEMSAWLERFWKNIIPQETGHTYSPNMINQTEFFIGPNKQFRAHGFYLKIWKGRFSNPAKFQGTMKTWEPDYVHKLRHSFNISQGLHVFRWIGHHRFDEKQKYFFVEKKKK